ncbi:MAG: hypothetical protein JWN48_1922 [Myxococcaceae bacterium]|nr:hypothetical protein [Myxococcaceae bacterium]
MSVEKQSLVFSWVSRARVVCAMGLATLALAAACGGDEPKDKDELHVDRGDLLVSWASPPDAAAQQLASAFRQDLLFENVASTLNATLKLERDLPVRHLACGEENAFYDPNTGSLSMCYELLEKITKVAYDPDASEQVVGDRVVGTWLFVFFHELGHGLVDQYELPITGREEDSVDDFSTVLMVEAGLSDYALHAAEYWAATDSGMFGQLDFADEHSLNPQRFYEIVCLVYGSDPRSYAHLVDNGFLPESRAQSCPVEYQKKRDAWQTLLQPWLK